MRRIWILFSRELRALILSPANWFILALVWLLYGVFWRWSIIPQHNGNMFLMTRTGGSLAIWLQIFLVPLQTMRLISEEKRTGTFEMLVTTPLKDHEIVIGKFLAAFVLNAFTWIVIPLYSWIMRKSGGDPDFGPAWTAYFSLVTAGAFLIGLGLIASACTRHMILAAIFGFVLVLMATGIPMLAGLVPDTWPNLQAALATGNLMRQTEQASRGLLDLVHVTYKLAFCGLFLLLTTRILEVRKWA